MDKMMEIKSLKVQNFGCIKDLEMKLTPLHAVIGPNDAGKSTLLRAVRTGMQLHSFCFNTFDNSAKGAKSGISPFDPGQHDDANVSLDLLIKEKWGFNYELNLLKSNQIREKLTPENGNAIFATRSLFQSTQLRTWSDMRGSLIQQDSFLDYYIKNCPDIRLALPRMVRLDPDSLRLPGGLISSVEPIDFEEKGYGLASVLDAMISRNLDGYLVIREQIRGLFPTVGDLAYENTDNNQKGLGIKLKNDKFVNSQFMSEGMLYYLAYAILKYLEPASIVFIEEPENGLHPSRIKEIMKIIRELSKTTQVLIATHSPLVINEMEPEEVSILWRDDEKGTQVMPITETSNFKDRSQVYALGELWLSYADGINEVELRTGKE